MRFLHFPKNIFGLISSLILILISFSLFISMTHLPSGNTESDRQQIIDHIHSIFKAFVQQDRVGIRARHTVDWTGFKNNSREIVQGIDGYMKDMTLKILKMEEYEIQDIEVQLYGNIAIVYYIAEWKSRVISTGQLLQIRARSVDIYRKDAKEWNQAGSHLSILPAPDRFNNLECRKCLDITLVPESEE